MREEVGGAAAVVVAIVVVAVGAGWCCVLGKVAPGWKGARGAAHVTSLPGEHGGPLGAAEGAAQTGRYLYK